MKLNDNLKKLFWMLISNTLITVYTAIFINLYIWGKNHSLADNAWYNLVNFIALGIAFLFGSQLLIKQGIKRNMQLSAIFSAVAFILLNIVSFENMILSILYVAIPIGISQGLFWSGMNSSISLFGKDSELTNFFSITNVSTQIINLFIPIFYALIIKQFGFSVSFSLMFVFILIMFVNASFLPQISLSDDKHDVSMFKNLSFKKVFHKKAYLWLVPTNLASGVISQFQFLFVLIFTFTITENAVYIALLNVLYTCCVVIARFIYTKKQNVNEFLWMNLGVMFLTLGVLVVFFPEEKLLILSNILISVGLFYFNTIHTSQQFRIFQEEDVIKRVQILAWREIILTFSRAIILMIALTVDNINNPIFMVILFIGVFSAVLTPFIQKKMFAEKEKDR